jgi:hypothetical protein
MDLTAARAPENVLILGDGNFSFSYALCVYLRGKAAAPPETTVFATSFDDADSLLDKYPETAGLLRALEAKHGCRVRHSVNATRPLLAQLRCSAPFQHIIFNFPHLGVEDAYLHSHLLGHIFLR